MEKIHITYDCDCSGHIYNYYLNDSKGLSITELRACLIELGYSAEEISEMIAEAEEVY